MSRLAQNVQKIMFKFQEIPGILEVTMMLRICPILIEIKETMSAIIMLQIGPILMEIPGTLEEIIVSNELLVAKVMQGHSETILVSWLSTRLMKRMMTGYSEGCKTLERKGAVIIITILLLEEMLLIINYHSIVITNHKVILLEIATVLRMKFCIMRYQYDKRQIMF